MRAARLSGCVPALRAQQTYELDQHYFETNKKRTKRVAEGESLTRADPGPLPSAATPPRPAGRSGPAACTPAQQLNMELAQCEPGNCDHNDTASRQLRAAACTMCSMGGRWR